MRLRAFLLITYAIKNSKLHFILHSIQFWVLRNVKCLFNIMVGPVIRKSCSLIDLKTLFYYVLKEPYFLNGMYMYFIFNPERD